MCKGPLAAGTQYLHGATKMRVWLEHRYQRWGKMKLNPYKHHISWGLVDTNGFIIILATIGSH